MKSKQKELRVKKGVRLLWVIAASTILAACGVNPVTGQREFQLVSESQEVQIGKQNYLPSRQMQGGRYTAHPDVGAYVSEVGQRIAAVSDRPLPYEFVVLNNSVPNAWALPGGKIAINRGLLVELENEAELAAVLGHEIVHAAARHGAKSMERGLLLQTAVAALQVSAGDNQFANAIVGGATVGAMLITTKYGRDAELQSDLYGTTYMARAGYNPNAAVSLQETFVRLSEGPETSWLDGLFASHPPSTERVAANRKTAAELGDTGDYGRERYAERLAPLLGAGQAYARYDDGVAALGEDELDRADALAREAIAIEPAEAKFYELRGDVALARERYDAAIAHYSASIERNPEYFKPYLQQGLARLELGDLSNAERDLQRSIELLPTANAHYGLGRIAQGRGDVDGAVEHYKIAATSQSETGQESFEALVRLDLPRHPDAYLRVEPRLDNQGRVIAVIENRTPVAIRDVRIAPVLYNYDGQVLQRPGTMLLRTTIPPGESAAFATGLTGLTAPEQLQLVRIPVVGAAIAE